ncbi:hypothetical protein HYR54_04495 [Candidatus Acetothermia bacterium]|nr:hypothetical protein [Candidatus Acetothermia bacterium]
MRRKLFRSVSASRGGPLIRVLCLLLIVLPALSLASSAQRGGGLPNPAQTKVDKIQARAQWFYGQRAYPLGYIPDRARPRALEERDRLSEVSPAEEVSPRSAPVEGNSWTSIGPAPIDTNGVDFPQVGDKASGRVTDIAVDPSNSDHWFIGAAQGGVWETTNAGASWTPKTDNQASLAIGALAIAPSSSNIIYAGTGEGNLGCTNYFGAGLLKSTDGGGSWTLLGTAVFAHRNFTKLKVHPTDPNTVLATTVFGQAGGKFACASPLSAPAAGIYKSTDGGSNWSLKLQGFATDLDADPTNFNNQYAGLFGGSENGLYRSTDGGDTWTFVSGPWTGLSGGVDRVALAIAPSNPSTVYVSITNASNGELLGLWRTDNAWAATPAWTQIPVGATDDGTGIHGYCGWDGFFHNVEAQCGYDHKLIVDPADNNTLYAGGIYLWKCSSCTASPTWTEISHVQGIGGPTNRVHPDHHALVWVGSRLIVGSDGGVWSTSDGGSTWTNHNTNLAITQFYSGSLHPTNPNVAFGGAQDNGDVEFTGSSAWTEFFISDGGDSIISATDPDTSWGLTGAGFTILRFNTGSVHFFREVDTGIDKTGQPFLPRMKKCPNDDDVVIVGTDNVWRTNNFFSSTPATPTWFSNSPDPLRPNPPHPGFPITAMAFAESDGACNIYAVGTAGRIFITLNGGASWADISTGLPNRYVTNLAFDPTNANTLYATFSGFDEGTPGQPGHAFKTTSATAVSPSWKNISPAVNIPFNAIVVDPFNPSVIHVGTDLGILRSDKGGSKWTTIGPANGIPNVAVLDLAVNHATNTLMAFTYGRGAFRVNLPAPPPLPPTTIATLKVDDGSFEQFIGFPGGGSPGYFVNRLTPPSYPATLKKILILFPASKFSLPVNTPISLLAGTNPSGNSNIDGITFQSINTSVGFVGRTGDVYILSSPLTINSGDFVVGFSVNYPPGIGPVTQDHDSPSQLRSYVSSDGATFSVIDTFGSNLAGNFLIRATVSLGAPPPPCTGVTATSSPTAVVYKNLNLKTLNLTIKNGGTTPVNITSIAHKTGLPLTIVSISPNPTTKTIQPGKKQKFTIKTQAAGPLPLTVLGPYFTSFISCGAGGSASVSDEELSPQSLSLQLRGNELILQTDRAVESMRLQLFDLSGRRLIDKTEASGALTLLAATDRHQPLANGVYLYVVSLRDKAGVLLQSEVRKLIIVR